MDHSLYGYLSRRSNEELEHFITLYWHLREDEFYKYILDMIEEILKERAATEES